MLVKAIPVYNACLILEVYVPEMSGVDLHKLLTTSGCRLPAIFITGHVDQATRSLMEKSGSVPVRYKPFSRQAVLAAVTGACFLSAHS